jgi:hypothetical protein
MNTNPNYHVFTNLGLMLLLFSLSVWCLWKWLPADTMWKLGASGLLFLVVFYCGHRIAPRLTSNFVERLFGKNTKDR